MFFFCQTCIQGLDRLFEDCHTTSKARLIRPSISSRCMKVKASQEREFSSSSHLHGKEFKPPSKFPSIKEIALLALLPSFSNQPIYFRVLEEEHKIHCNLTLLFSFAQVMEEDSQKRHHLNSFFIILIVLVNLRLLLAPKRVSP